MKNVYDIYSLIGKNMKKIRKEKIKLSQEKMSEQVNMSRSFISQIESPNVDVGVSIDSLFILAQQYNFDIRDFFEGYESLMSNEAKDNNKTT